MSDSDAVSSNSSWQKNCTSGYPEPWCISDVVLISVWPRPISTTSVGLRLLGYVSVHCLSAVSVISHSRHRGSRVTVSIIMNKRNCSTCRRGLNSNVQAYLRRCNRISIYKPLPGSCSLPYANLSHGTTARA